MKKEDKIFFCLLQCLRNVICGEKISLPVLSDEELEQLYLLSTRQDVAHIVSVALRQDRKMAENPFREKFQQQEHMAIYRYMNQDYALQEIRELFSENQIPFIPLKGSVLRQYYPEPWLRTSGDIDILIHEENVAQATGLLTDDAGFTCEGGNKKDISFMRDECVHVELHRNLIRTDAVRPLQTGQIWAHATEHTGDWSMSDADFYAFHIEHMKNHFCTGGCGVRFFLDLWILNHRMNFVQEERTEILRQCGLAKFEEAARALMEVWFGNGLLMKNEKEDHGKQSNRNEAYCPNKNDGQMENEKEEREKQNRSRKEASCPNENDGQTENEKEDHGKQNNRNEANCPNGTEGAKKRSWIEAWNDRHTALTRQMQEFILSAGVYGTIDNWALIQEVQNKSKIKSIWKRLWLPYEDLCWSYPGLQGHRYLQPWFEAKRFFKMIADGRWNRSVMELKANRSLNEEKRQTIQNMLTELELKN